MTLLLALACTGADEEPLVVDATLTYREPVEGELVFASEPIEVPPYTDQQICTMLPYTGETVGVMAGDFYQHPDWGHHLLIMSSNADEDDYPDGYSWDCTESANLPMAELEPILFANNTELGDEGLYELVLPEGFGVKLESGDRLMLQSHHINSTADTLLLNDAAFLEVLPEAEVDTWAAPWAHTDSGLEVPANSEHTIEIDCAFEEDVYLLSVTGHLHEWGTAISVDHLPADGGDTTRLYEISEWDPVFRDAPPIDEYPVDTFQVKAGDTFRTTCSWYNDTPETLGFPTEMCASVGMAYPTVLPIICDVD